MSDESPTRRYHSPVRQEQAALTRRRILDAAADLFETRGYDGTTVAAIAAGAGVAVDTVATLGTKSTLLLEGFRVRAIGEGGPQTLLERDFAQDIFAITDPDQALDAVTGFMTAAHHGSARLWMLIRAAATTDPQVVAVLDELKQSRDQSYDVTVDWLVGLGAVPAPDPDALDDHRTRTRLVLAAESFVQLTDDYGLSLDDYRAWLREELTSGRSR